MESTRQVRATLAKACLRQSASTSLGVIRPAAQSKPGTITRPSRQTGTGMQSAIKSKGVRTYLNRSPSSHLADLGVHRSRNRYNISTSKCTSSKHTSEFGEPPAGLFLCVSSDDTMGGILVSRHVGDSQIQCPHISHSEHAESESWTGCPR